MHVIGTYLNIIYIALNYKFQIEIFLRKIKIIRFWRKRAMRKSGNRVFS